MFSNTSAPAFHMRLQKPTIFDHHFFDFSKCYWELHFSYVFDMASTCYNNCALRKLKKLHHIQFYYKFPTFFNDFMLAQFGVTSTKLQTIQQTCPNMLRFRALMSTKLHCA